MTSKRRVISLVVTVLVVTGITALLLFFASPGVLTAEEQGAGKGTHDGKSSAGDAKGEAKADGAPAPPPPALIRVGVSSQKELQPRFEAIGRFREIRRVVVGSGQQGRVVEMKIEEGDEVTGQQTVLARIDPTFTEIELKTMDARLLEAQAAVEEAKANLDQAKRDRVYYEDLEKSQSAKPRDVDNARSTERAKQAILDRALAAVTSAEQEIQRVTEEKSRFNVVAPFDGVVVRKWMELGQWVQKGAPVVELISRGEIDAVVDVPERHVNSLIAGSQIELRVDALNTTASGKIQAIVPDGTSAARTFPVKIRLDDQKGKLKPGMSITAWMPSGQKSTMLTVPRDAVLISAGTSVVWAVIDGKAMKIDVDVLFGAGDEYAVRAARRNAGPPLAAGMQVVIEGGERILFPGQPVEIMQR